MDYRLYPTFIIAEHKGIIPNISVPENFKELVPEFYKKRGREKVDYYVKGLEKWAQSFGVVEIKLNWDNKSGLENISVGTHGGLDLIEEPPSLPFFQEHNLGGLNGFIAASIAMKYVSELLKQDI